MSGAAAHPAAETERREKRRVTLVSVAAAAVLTAVKLVVALATGSLGLLSEAAHSGLDTVASVFTLFSVRLAGRPADEGHPYGHGRIENLSAIFQGLLLAATAGAIVYESLRRLFFVSVEVETSVWTFAVMAGSIVLDLWRSRLLLAAARKYHSKALEADALNFRADMLSSSVVILGLALTAYANRWGGPGWLGRADAAAALLVALIIIFMSGRLALQSLHVLLDRAPHGLPGRLTEAVAGVPGVVGVEPVRVRESGHRVFADVVVTTPRLASLAEAHDISERIESAVRRLEPRAETLVHVEPVAADESAAEALRAVALRLGLRTHHEQVRRVGDGLVASLHLEVPSVTELGDAHERAHALVQALKEDNPRLTRVDSHIEVATPELHSWREVGAAHPDVLRAIRREVTASGMAFHEARLYELPPAGGERPPYWTAVLHCGLPASLTMREVHRRTDRLEHQLRQLWPRLEQVVIHAEPRAQPDPRPK